MESKSSKDENFLITAGDILLICGKAKYKIAFFTFLFAALFGFYCLTRPVQYLAEATFRERHKPAADAGRSLSLSLLAGLPDGSESGAASMMKSRKLMEELFQMMGLQAVISKDQYNFQIFNNIKNNLYVEYAYFRNLQAPAIQDPSPIIKAKNIVYDQETPIGFRLVFDSENSYRLLKLDRQEIGTGQLEEPFVGPNFTFTIIRCCDEPLTGVELKLALLPLSLTAEKVAKKIQAVHDSHDKGLLKLSFKCCNRHEGSETLNNLMTIYQNYMRREQQRITYEQIAYLNKRQDETALQLKSMMEKHAHSLSNNMMTMESLFQNQQSYSAKILLMDLELKRLQHSLDDGVTYYDRLGSDSGDPVIINQILQDIRIYKQKADGIDLALRNMPAKETEVLRNAFHDQLAELENLRLSIAEGKSLLTDLLNNTQTTTKGPLIRNPKYLIQEWNQRLRENETAFLKAPGDQKPMYKECMENCRAYYIAYLANIIRFLEVEESIGQERLTNLQSPQLKFQGIDLDTANQLYANYSRSLNEVESDILHYQFIVDQMKDPGFEPSSLSSVLSDPVSKDIISKAGSLALMLKDEANRSQRELDRLKEDLALQKSFLILHVEQTLQLQYLRKNLYQENILSLQNATLNLVQQQISVLEKHLDEYISSRIENLKQEKLVFESQQQDLKEEMQKMPSKWASEKLIDQHLEMSRKMVEKITELVESKNLSTNLDIAQSSPIDHAIPSLHPLKPRLLLFILLGALTGGFLSSGFFISRSIIVGVPATQENLLLQGQHVAGVILKTYLKGKIEPLLDADLETLRRAIAHVASVESEGEGQTLLLLTSHGIDYSHHFAELFGRSGFKVLLLPITFDEESSQEEMPGLIQYIEGKIVLPKINARTTYDFVAPGGVSRYSGEMAASRRFQEFLKIAVKEYDWVIAVSHALPASGEAENLVSSFQNSIITIIDEKLRDLKPYTQIALKKKISFIFTASIVRPGQRNF